MDYRGSPPQNVLPCPLWSLPCGPLPYRRARVCPFLDTSFWFTAALQHPTSVFSRNSRLLVRLGTLYFSGGGGGGQSGFFFIIDITTCVSWHFVIQNNYHLFLLAEFKRAVKVATGQELSENVLDTVFKIFDLDGDNCLSHGEFLGVLKNRLHRGLKVRESYRFCAFTHLEGMKGT